MEQKFQQLQKFDIKFVAVFDGLKLTAKQAHQQREDKISNYSSKLQSLNSLDEDEEGEELFYKIHSQKIDKEITHIFIDFCKEKKYPFVVAPFEADAQLLFLLHSGQIDYIYSEDSDILARGCDSIVRGLKMDNSVRVFDERILEEFLGQKKGPLMQQRSHLSH